MGKIPIYNVSRLTPSNFDPRETLMNVLQGLRARALVAASMVFWLTACGGGGSPGADSAPVASAAQMSAGVVTGFGSVYVDGLRLDDSQAQVVSVGADGSVRTVPLQLGQRVRVSHDEASRATRVVVDASVIGRVAAIDISAGSLTVAGQAVVINLDNSVGPVTVFGGSYRALADVALQDVVEVHGAPVVDAGNWTVRATRIDRRTDGPGVKVSGVVSSVVNSSSEKTFVLGGLTVDFGQALSNGRVTPSVERLVDGVAVRVFGPTTALEGAVLAATAVRIGGDREGVEPNTRIQLGGAVSEVDATNSRFQLEGTTVRFGEAAIMPTGATFGPSSWVKIAGLVASDGVVDAERIVIRQGNVESDEARVKLIGPISELYSNDSFVVRELAVDASGVTVRAGCPALLSDGVLVNITASLQPGSDVLLATRLSCTGLPAPERAVRPLGGRIIAVDGAQQRVTLTAADGGTAQLGWNEATAFVGHVLSSGADLAIGQDIRAEGLLVDGIVVARLIALHGARPVDRFRKPPAMSSDDSQARVRANWNDYFTRPPR